VGKACLQNHDPSSGDVLTAGAATAIMEVILPIDERLQSVMATTRAATEESMQTSNTSTYRSHKKSAVPNRFRASHNHHHPMVNNSTHHHQQQPHNYNNSNTNNSNGTKKRSVEQSESNQNVLIDQERPGFAAARQLQQQQRNYKNGTNYNSTSNHNNTSNVNNHSHSRSTDDRVYQQFVKRQREQHGR
jgi:hypothetical protein